MHDKVGIVSVVTERFCQKAEVAVPEELVRADGEVGVEKDFQDSAMKKEGPLFNSGKSFLGSRFSAYLFPVKTPFGIEIQEFCDRALRQPSVGRRRAAYGYIFFASANDIA